jgi:hypothetical protein
MEKAGQVRNCDSPNLHAKIAGDCCSSLATGPHGLVRRTLHCVGFGGRGDCRLGRFSPLKPHVLFYQIGGPFALIFSPRLV